MQQPPYDPGLIPFTVAKAKRLYMLFNQTLHSIARGLRWSHGDAGTGPAPAGTTTAPGYAAWRPSHDQVTKYGCRKCGPSPGARREHADKSLSSRTWLLPQTLCATFEFIN
jgi:hypothetical protein